MTTLVECPGCTRHVRIDDQRCPFCGRPSTTSAPSRMLALVLPLTLMAYTGCDNKSADDGKAKPAAKDSKDGKAKPADDAKAKPGDDTKAKPDDGKAKPDGDAKAPVEQPSTPADDGSQAGEEGGDDGRKMATKYGGPPPPIGGEIKPEPKPTPDEDRPARKYGAPPPPDREPKIPKH